jgi:RNA polymerase-binding transcription factor DksA
MVKRHPLLSHLAPPSAPPPPPAAGGAKPKKLTASFLKKQRQKLLDLRDTLVDQMNGVARDTLGKGEDNHDSSAFGMHQADAGSDAYDRDFALNLLSQEQDALHRIDEALLRVDSREYGICEGSGAAIPIARLEAMPFARRTVEYQEIRDQEVAAGMRRSPADATLFGIDEKEASPTASKDE